jgi:DNA-binding cell septation regulator SpoVG
LLTKIATDDKFRNAVTVSADEKLIVMKLKALHLARGHARKHYGLQV